MILEFVLKCQLKLNQKITNISLHQVKREKELQEKKVNALKDGFLILIAIVGFFLKKITRF